MLFTKTPPIYHIIDEYASWKYDRHPLVAGGQKSLLYRFAQRNHLENVEDIEIDQIAFFVGEELTAFYGDQALRALRAFLWYCQRAGYPVISYKMATERHLRGAGKRVNWEMVKKVRELREGKGLTFDAISRELTEEGRRVHKTQAIRWWKKAAQLPY